MLIFLSEVTEYLSAFLPSLLSSFKSILVSLGESDSFVANSA